MASDDDTSSGDPDDFDLDDLKVVDIKSGKPAAANGVRRKPNTRAAGSGDDSEVSAVKFPSTEDCPVLCLGKGERVYYFLTPSGAMKALNARDLATASVLGELFDGDTKWLRNYFPSDKGSSGFAASGVGFWLIRQCVRLGFFNPDTGLRARGVWRLDGGELLVHLGDAIWRYDPDGRRIATFEAGLRIADHVYPEFRRDPRPAEPDDAATAQDIDRVLELLQSWNWAHPRDAEILLGWIGAAMIAGALRWRPHIWVGGLPASGKSSLEQFVRGLFGPGGVVRASEPSRAYIVDALAGAARPVMLDEFERNIDSTMQDMIVELSRLASTDDQSGIGRSSLSGEVRHKPLRAAMYFSGVARPPMRQQDLRRIYVTQLLPLADATEASRALLAEIKAPGEKLGARIKARALASWPRFRANFAAFDEAITQEVKRGGVVDQLGTLLAMAYALLKDQAMTVREAAAALKGFDLTTVIGDAETVETAQCAQHLLSTSITYDVEKGRLSRLVGELLSDCCETPGYGETGEAGRALRRHGMRIELYPFAAEDVAEPCLVIANRHQGLEVIFRGSRWEQGVWAQFFDRPLGEACSAPVRFSGIQVRAKRIPLRRLPGVLDESKQVEIEQALRDRGVDL